MLKSDSNSSVDAAAGASRPRWDAVADLRLHVGRLYGLLSEPQLGLSSWSVMMGQEWRWIADAWNHGFDEHGPRLDRPDLRDSK